MVLEAARQFKLKTKQNAELSPTHNTQRPQLKYLETYDDNVCVKPV